MIIKANSIHMPLKDKSVQSIITSPPYWSLRNYDIPETNFPDGWVGQLGQEPDLELFIEHLMQVMNECWRVLKGDGVCFVNLGDTYKRKSLCFIPERFALACLDADWIIRNKIVWYKPNGMPDSSKDRFAVKHELVYMLVKQQKYSFDLDTVRVPHKPKSFTAVGCKFNDAKGTDGLGKVKAHNFANSMQIKKLHPKGVNPGNIWQSKKWDNNSDRPSAHRNYNGPKENGSNPGDLWEICPQKYPETHFATFPEKLVERMLLCSTKPGDIVLDPFGGSGTTGKVSLKHMRKPILLDLGYQELQKNRLKEDRQPYLIEANQCPGRGDRDESLDCEG